jgi:hypothetical protein
LEWVVGILVVLWLLNSFIVARQNNRIEMYGRIMVETTRQPREIRERVEILEA